MGCCACGCTHSVEARDACDGRADGRTHGPVAPMGCSYGDVRADGVVAPMGCSYGDVRADGVVAPMGCSYEDVRGDGVFLQPDGIPKWVEARVNDQACANRVHAYVTCDIQ